MRAGPAPAKGINMEQIRTQLTSHDVIFIAGETGCGKTTNVPWGLAKTYSRVACCMPRRLQAKRAAKRVREIFQVQADVGWAIGGERSPHGSKLTYFTHGCFIRHVGQWVAAFLMW